MKIRMNINPNESQSQTQSRAILAHLQAGGTLTQLDALKLFGCARLSARIYDLKQAGHEVHSEMVKDLRSGKHFKQYSMVV